MHKIILNERNLCHDDLGKKKVKYAAKYDAINPDEKSEILKKSLKKFTALVLMCVQTQVLTGQTLNPDMFWMENLHGYVIQMFLSM